VGVLVKVMPSFDSTQAKKDFGEQFLAEERCEECGVCAKLCPYSAIELTPKPVFDHQACYGCWSCYNHCRSQAIHTPKFTGDHQYPKPIDHVREVLRASPPAPELALERAARQRRNRVLVRASVAATVVALFAVTAWAVFGCVSCPDHETQPEETAAVHWLGSNEP